MQSRIQIFGHALHPIIVPFPIAFNTTTMVCCLAYAANGDFFWFRVAFMTNCAAVIMSAVAVLPGLIDWLAIPELTDAKTTGLKHMVANVFTLGFFTANGAVMFTELDESHPPAGSHILMTVFGFFVMLYAGFQGWKMVQTHHVGVDMTVHEEIPEQEEVEKNANEIFTNATEGSHQRN